MEMAYRIHESILSGVIDCRIKGRISGQLELVGSDQPIQLDLQGLPHPDLAGLILRFRNPHPKSALPDELHPVQHGRCGDLTASRKHPILDLPIKEAWELGIQGLPVPQHMANVLYLEWFSSENGRVVIEIPEAELEIEGPPTWRMTEDEIRGQQQDMLHSLEDFSDLLADSLEEDPPDPDADDDFYPF